MAALLAFANSAEASHGRFLTVCSKLPVEYTTASTARVVNAPNLQGNRACVDVEFDPKPRGHGTYYGKVIWTNDSPQYERYPMEIDETLTISADGKCSASYQVSYNGPNGHWQWIDSEGCQFENGSEVVFGSN
jgi:hypothetical protein